MFPLHSFGLLDKTPYCAGIKSALIDILYVHFVIVLLYPHDFSI